MYPKLEGSHWILGPTSIASPSFTFSSPRCKTCLHRLYLFPRSPTRIFPRRVGNPGDVLSLPYGTSSRAITGKVRSLRAFVRDSPSTPHAASKSTHPVLRPSTILDRPSAHLSVPRMGTLQRSCSNTVAPFSCVSRKWHLLGRFCICNISLEHWRKVKILQAPEGTIVDTTFPSSAVKFCNLVLLSADTSCPNSSFRMTDDDANDLNATLPRTTLSP